MVVLKLITVTKYYWSNQKHILYPRILPFRSSSRYHLKKIMIIRLKWDKTISISIKTTKRCTVLDVSSPSVVFILFLFKPPTITFHLGCHKNLVYFNTQWETSLCLCFCWETFSMSTSERWTQLKLMRAPSNMCTWIL